MASEGMGCCSNTGLSVRAERALFLEDLETLQLLYVMCYNRKLLCWFRQGPQLSFSLLFFFFFFFFLFIFFFLKESKNQTNTGCSRNQNSPSNPAEDRG